MSYSIIPTEHIARCFLGSPNAGWEAELPAVGHLSLSLLHITKCPLSRCLCFLFVSSCTDFCLTSSLHTNRQQDRCFLALVLLKVSSCHQYDPLWHYCIISVAALPTNGRGRLNMRILTTRNNKHIKCTSELFVPFIPHCTVQTHNSVHWIKCITNAETAQSNMTATDKILHQLLCQTATSDYGIN